MTITFDSSKDFVAQLVEQQTLNRHLFPLFLSNILLIIKFLVSNIACLVNFKLVNKSVFK